MSQDPNDKLAMKDEASSSHLSISSHVVVQLGAELVTDVEQALLELAKNAYDADSETCEIIVEPDWEISPTDPEYDLLFPDRKDTADRQKEKVGRLRVRDCGLGIPADAVNRGWLRISASLKRASGEQAKQKTKKNRTPVGDKGLGRLATMKIGTVLRLKTATEGESQWRTVSFSWADFTPERTLDQVPVFEGTNSEDFDGPGTIIEIIGLHDPAHWNNPIFVERELVPNLSTLISPFQSQDNFSITVKMKSRVFELETLHDDVLNLASAKFEFIWDGSELSMKSWIAPPLFRGVAGEEGQEKFDLVFNEINKPKLLSFLANKPRLRDHNIDIKPSDPWLLKFSEKNQFQTFPTDKQYPGAINPGPFHAEIYSFMFNEATKNKLQQAGMSTPQMQSMATIAIYRDGFRVRAQKDWLRLSESQTKGGSFYELRPTNVLGFFALSNEHNSGLVEKSDREGFVDNREFRGFMSLSQRCKSYANNILEATRKTYNEFATTLFVNNPIPPTSHALTKQLKDAESESNQNIRRAKSTLSKALKELTEARTTLNLKHELSVDVRSTMSTPLEHASTDLIKSLEALQLIEEKLVDHSRLSEAMHIVRLSDDEQKYRLIEAAAVGLSARSFSHELHHYVRQLRDGVALVVDRNQNYRDEKIREATKMLSSVTRELAKLVATIDPLLPGSRSLKEKIQLHEFLRKYVEARKSFAETKGADLIFNTVPTSLDLEVKFSRARLLQIVENLFNNSLYWVTHGPLSHGRERRIVIETTETGFIWYDNGPGISPSLESSIFEPFVSDKPASEGQGLGLHIVSTFLEAERCSIQLSAERNEIGRRFKFIVTLSGATTAHQQPKLFAGND
ncbi:sensor histidine kinase [Paludibacterium sp. B53371]|uniref:sensor histidine kinase n=1 Tax=Paludibacterium sp. B53371 TaxID=2806263 RepID=UPI001C059EF9|nr:sensor histidine kinase [Paludibacterium sp. B53371]